MGTRLTKTFKNRMTPKTFRKHLLGLSAALVFFIFAGVTKKLWVSGEGMLSSSLNRDVLRSVLGKKIISARSLDSAAGLSIDQEDFQVEYSIDHALQAAAEKYLKHAQVPYASAVALDPATGRVLALVSDGSSTENLALRATFPAASIFKIVTAAAAIQDGKLQYDSMIPVLGSYHTLYKRNLFSGGGLEPQTAPRFARLISLRDAFGKSVNSVFGKIGLFGVGGTNLRRMAEGFYFGPAIPFELAVDSSSAVVPDGGFELAESASGFTRQNLMSPLHGALIAATIANQGVMMTPSVIDRVRDSDSDVVYLHKPQELSQPISETTADQLAKLMNRTITSGTSRRSFRGLDRNPMMAGVYIGGKTGTLNGNDPPGRYDWFVGFANRDGVRIAIATLCIHGKYYGVKASTVARQILESFYEAIVTAEGETKSTAPSKRS